AGQAKSEKAGDASPVHEHTYASTQRQTAWTHDATVRQTASAEEERSLQQQYRRLRWLFALVGVSILGDTALYTVLPVYAAELGIPLVWVGVILSANRFVRLLSNPIAARLFERAGVAPVFMGGLVLAVVTTASYGLFTHVAVLVVARMLWGT